MSEINNNPYNHINFKHTSIKEDEKCIPETCSGDNQKCEPIDDLPYPSLAREDCGSIIGSIPGLQQPKQCSYVLRTPEQLHNLIKKFNQNKEKLSEEDIAYYQRFIDKYNETAKSTPFQENLDAKKAFLALKKLDKYEYNTSAIPAGSHIINENSDMLGQYSNDYTKLTKLLSSDLAYKYAMKNFYNQLYKPQAFACFFDDNKSLVHKEAQDVLDEELSGWDDNLEDLYEDFDFRSATYTCDVDNPWNNWNLRVLISGNIDEDNAYLPKELVILHELYHVKQTSPGAPEDYTDPFVELGATLDSVVKSDEIHKKLNNIPLDEIIEYPYNFNKTNGEKINLGEIVNKFREINQKYNCKNWEQVFMTREGKCLIQECFS